MKITVADLEPLELETLEFDIDLVKCDEAQKAYIYDNLFRGEDGVAYYFTVEYGRKHFIYT